MIPTLTDRNISVPEEKKEREMSDRITAIIEKMTLEEKAGLCTGASSWTTTPIDRLGVPEMTMSDGPHGVRRVEDVHALIQKSLPATCFPTASCLASTWDVDLIQSMGQSLAEECIALDVDVVLGPGANIKRSPLGGRNFEYFSEDPYLAGKMAASFINGVQSAGVGTSLKHFAVNNQETQRLTINADVDERTLREIYLPAFEMAVTQAKPWTVMCAYNKLNGNFCSENHRLLVDILKSEWEFEGLVVSDWGAVHDRVASLEGGLDLEMPGPRALRVSAVVDAVRSGKLDEAVLNESVRRILRIVFKAREVEKGTAFDEEGHHVLAREIAAQGMVLLKNDGVLPLKNPQRIAVIGRSAREPYFQGGGSSHINPTRVDSPLDELLKYAGDAEVTFTEGYPQGNEYDQGLIDSAVEHAAAAEVGLLYVALPSDKESEGYDRTDLDLSRHQAALIKAVTAVQPHTVVILNNGAPVAVSDWIDETAAVLEAWMMGQAGGGAIADVLYGKVNPSGRLAETFPEKLADTPSHINFPGENGVVRYGEGIFVGYRYYDEKEMAVQFPFGYGLSYTTFSYSNPKVSAETFRDVDGIAVSVDITNTGDVPGKEVVQVYVHDHAARLRRPHKELKGFKKVDLKPGETKTVTLELDFRAFAYYHPVFKRWITDDGEFGILIGSSAQNIHHTLNVVLQSTVDLPSILDRESTIRSWLEDPVGSKVFAPLYNQVLASMKENINDDDDPGMELSTFLMDMPLLSCLYFLGDTLPAAPEELVTDLLSKVHHGSSGL